MNKLFLIATMLFICTATQAQEQPSHFGLFGFQSGYEQSYQKPFIGFFGGYRANNNYFGAAANAILPASGRKTPIILSVEYGYTIGSFQPYIMFSHFSSGAESVAYKEGISGFAWGGGLSFYTKSLPLKFSVGLSNLQDVPQIKTLPDKIYVSVGWYRNF